MDLEIIMLSEVSQTMRHEHQMLSLTCGIWKKDTLNFLTEQILTHRLCKTYGFQSIQIGVGVGGWTGVWDENPTKLDCGDHCPTLNIINSLSNKKWKSLKQVKRKIKPFYLIWVLQILLSCFFHLHEISFFHALTFNLYISFALRECHKQHIVGSCFFIQSFTLHLLIGAFSPWHLR